MAPKPPTTNTPQPTAQHRRFCLRQHINVRRDANTRVFTSEDIKYGMKGLIYGGLQFHNDHVSRVRYLNDTQRQALRNWADNSFPPLDPSKSVSNDNPKTEIPLGQSTSAPFPLKAIFNTFDNYLFHGALHGRVDVVLTDSCPNNAHKGHTADAPGPRHRATISIKRPDPKLTTWTPHLVKGIVETLLHEMIHALFNVYECRCASCSALAYRALNTGVEGSGHGPNWRELGRAVQEEAGKMFEVVGGEEAREFCEVHGVEGGRWEWDFDVRKWGEAHALEVKFVLEKRREGGIGAVEGALLDGLLE